MAQLTTSLQARATSAITAMYSGDGNFLGSTSSNSAGVVVALLDCTYLRMDDDYVRVLTLKELPARRGH